MYHSSKVISTEIVTDASPFTTHASMGTKKEIKLNPLNKIGIRDFNNYLIKNPYNAGEIVLLRNDMNTPFKKIEHSLQGIAHPELSGYMIDSDKRMTNTYPEIRMGLEKKRRMIVVYHIEDKADKANKFKDNHWTFEKLQHWIERDFGKGKIRMDRVVEPLFAGEEAKSKLKMLKNGELDLLLMQNIRVDKTECEMEKNGIMMFPELIETADVYVFGAFDAHHRNHTSLYLYPKAMRELGKPVMVSDSFISACTNTHRLHQAFKEHPDKSFVLSGGTKVLGDGGEDEGKIDILRSFVNMKIQNIAVGGKMALYFTAAQHKKVGLSNISFERAKYLGIDLDVWNDQQLVPAGIEEARKLLIEAKRNGINLHVPTTMRTASWEDLPYIFGKETKKDLKVYTYTDLNIPDDQVCLDIGEETAYFYARLIKEAEYRYFNGEMGVSIHPKFAHGTYIVIKAFDEVDHGYGMLGGGDTDAAIVRSGLLQHNTPYSLKLTGGAASMKYIVNGYSTPTIQNLIYPDDVMDALGYKKEEKDELGDKKE